MFSDVFLFISKCLEYDIKVKKKKKIIFYFFFFYFFVNFFFFFFFEVNKEKQNF